MADTKSVRQAAEATIASFGKVHFVVNNAGVFPVRDTRLYPMVIYSTIRKISDNFLPALIRDNMHLVTNGIVRITADRIETLKGDTIPSDAIIYVTGFDIEGLVHSLGITGRTAIHGPLIAMEQAVSSGRTFAATLANSKTGLCC